MRRRWEVKRRWLVVFYTRKDGELRLGHNLCLDSGKGRYYFERTKSKGIVHVGMMPSKVVFLIPHSLKVPNVYSIRDQNGSALLQENEMLLQKVLLREVQAITKILKTSKNLVSSKVVSHMSFHSSPIMHPFQSNAPTAFSSCIPYLRLRPPIPVSHAGGVPSPFP